MMKGRGKKKWAKIKRFLCTQFQEAVKNNSPEKNF